jgi:hypothetical protein
VTASLWQKFLVIVFLWQRLLVIAILWQRYLAIAIIWHKYLAIVATDYWQRFLVLNAIISQRYLAIVATNYWQRFLAIRTAFKIWLKWNVIIIGMTVGTTTAGIIVIGIGVTLVIQLVASVPLYILLQLWLNSSNNCSNSSRLFNDNCT